MMTDSKFKVLTADQLSNDEYHDKESWCAEYVSGSSLGDIYATCPAAWRFAVRKDTGALEFGTQSHTVMLEVDRFDKTYRRAPAADDFKNAITSQMALASHLKNVVGLKGTSGKQYPDLIKMMVDADLDLNVMWLIEMIAESQARAHGVELVKPESYDNCMSMRSTILNIPEHAAIINSPTAYRELSIFGEIFGVKVKVRIDHVDIQKNYTIWEWDENLQEHVPTVHPEVIVITDYKTTQSVKPEEFGRHAYNFGYYLKMALQRDLFVAAHDEKRPVVVQLLAQEKKEPFLPLCFRITKDQLRIGRNQYVSVIHQFSECKKHDVWPSYENGAPVVDLPMPEFVKYRHKDIILS